MNLLGERISTSMLANERFALAYHLWEEGFSIIPLTADGKKPVVKWKQYQTELCTFGDLRNWFIDNDFAPAIVTGQLSGITVIDCDNEEAIEAAKAMGFDSPVTQRTKRGMHFVFRHNGERNTVHINGIEGIDRRGEGGYVKAYPDSMEWVSDSFVPLAAIAELPEDLRKVSG